MPEIEHQALQNLDPSLPMCVVHQAAHLARSAAHIPADSPAGASAFRKDKVSFQGPPNP